MSHVLITSSKADYNLSELIGHANTGKKHFKPSLSNVKALSCNSSSGAEQLPSIEEIAQEAGITSFEFDAPSNPKIGEAPLLDNGLNLLYAPQSYGKSYTAIAIAGESGLPSVFIDLESNGKMFVNHCKRNGVAYVYAGGSKNIMVDVKKLVTAIKNRLGKVLIIIDSYSDMFPDDEGKMAQQAQKQLGDLHRFFMREVELPILILDHATEQKNQLGLDTGFKIEGNKSGKFKKTVSVLRLEKIGGDIENGTFVTVERSRNQDELPVGHIQQYKRSEYLRDKIQMLINDGKIPEAFKSKDLEYVLTGDDRKLWRAQRDDIATPTKALSRGRGKPAEIWTLNKREND